MRRTAAVVAGLAVLAGAGAIVHHAPAAAESSGLRAVHTPRTVVGDLNPALGACHYRQTQAGAVLPDPACTPGAVDPALTVLVICAPGFSTDTVRPPARLTDLYKGRSAGAYEQSTVGAEYDHLVPLWLGGASTTSNLWVEPGGVPNAKDKVEGALHRAVCAGKLDLAVAQRRIATDWTTALRGVG